MVEILVISSAASGWVYTARRDRQGGEHTLVQVVSVKKKDPFGFFWWQVLMARSGQIRPQRSAG
ncbi:hypothetical protein A9G06_08825 [Aeromonas sp. DNP9]|nr:hypothetical protein A9G06_08825 [Aeromonas sp. DNP9]